MKGNDLIQAPTWFLWDYDHTYREPGNTRVEFTWEFMYDLIDHVNTIIQEVPLSSLSEVEKTEFVAHARALRAYFYFQLAMEFQHCYDLDPTAAAPPIYTEPSTEPQGMSTLELMYAFILEDINYAIANLTEERLGKAYVNVNVANGIKARVLMAMNQDWDQVETAANAAYGGNVAAVLNAAGYTGGFDDINDTEWLWGMNQSGDQTNFFYCAPHAFMDHYADAYFGTYINSNFVAEFSATDVRNTFENAYGAPVGHYMEYISTKFTFAFSSDIPMMRTAEMILIEAEAKYHQGEADAHDLLYALQLDRDPSAVRSTNTGADLLEEILLERRKELYGEIGVEWFDAKRLQRGITRDGNHRIFVTLVPNDNRFILKIPEDEINANPNISEAVNDDRD